jgi:exosome complex RNA-binding protein Csl4
MPAEEGALVAPGDIICTEEEFVASDNAYVDKGSVRSTIFGKVHMAEGKVSVNNPGSEIRTIKRGMYVIGTVVADLRAVAFVDLDTVRIGGVEYLALKDGKIVAERDGPRGRNFGPRPPGRSSEPKPPKQCAVGDIVFAKVLFEDPEIYTLGIRDSETGVVFASCELCGTPMGISKERSGALMCPKCKHVEQRKISTMYNNIDEIQRRLSAKETNIMATGR